LREPTEQRRQAEQGDADDKNTLAPKAICQRSGHHQYRRASQRIGIHDPLHAAEITMHQLLKRGQDDRNARDFQAEHQ
jgi:hypothetical protein